MSRTNSVVNYNVNLTIARGEVNASWGAVFTDAAGMTDDLALDLARAFRDLPWPAGVDATAFVTKHDMTDLQSEGDLDAGVFV